MKIQYLSDLHLEFIKDNKIQNIINKIIPDKNVILILSGDIGNPYSNNYKKFMEFVNNNFKKTFIICGNHEYYNNNIEETNIYLEIYFKQFTNIKFLNNDFEYYENHYFIGSTLWTKITNKNYLINDVYKINNFNCDKCNELNLNCVNFLNKITKNKNNVIIITHHIPLNDLIDKKYKKMDMIPYNQWFYCDMTEFIENNNIKYWFYGHTHTPLEIIHKKINFCCNPIGYPNENTINNYNKYIEI
jgi:predicted phosphohydrolase